MFSHHLPFVVSKNNGTLSTGSIFVLGFSFDLIFDSIHYSICCCSNLIVFSSFGQNVNNLIYNLRYLNLLQLVLLISDI